jgi:hypothetical protein
MGGIRTDAAAELRLWHSLQVSARLEWGGWWVSALCVGGGGGGCEPPVNPGVLCCRCCQHAHKVFAHVLAKRLLTILQRYIR